MHRNGDAVGVCNAAIGPSVRPLLPWLCVICHVSAVSLRMEAFAGFE